MAQQPAYSCFDDFAQLIQPHLLQMRALNFSCPLDSTWHPYKMGLFDEHAPMGVSMAPYVFSGGGVLHLNEEGLRLRVDLERYDNLGREPSRSLQKEMGLGRGGIALFLRGGGGWGTLGSLRLRVPIFHVLIFRMLLTCIVTTWLARLFRR